MPLFAQRDPLPLAIDPTVASLLGQVLVGYVVVMLAVSVYAARRVRTEADYLVAGRRLPLLLVTGTLVATWFDAATLFAASAAAREHGLVGVTLNPFAAAAALVLAGLTAAALADPNLGDGDPLRGLGVLFAKVAASHPDHLRLVPAGSSLAVLLGWLAAWATGLFGNIPAQDLQQRVFAARSPTAAMVACILAGIGYLLVALLPVTLGLATLVTHPEGGLDPVGFLASRHLSAGMLVLFVVAVASIVISTATSAVLAPASILGHNLLARVPSLAGRPLFRERLSVVLVSLGGIGMACWDAPLMKLLDVSLSIQLVALFVPLVMGIYGRPRGQSAAVLSMVLGFTAWLVMFAVEQLSGLLPAGLAAATTVPAAFWGLGFAIFGYALGQRRAVDQLPGNGSKAAF